MTEAYPSLEHRSYNALAGWLLGDYRKLAALRAASNSWAAAYARHAKEAGDADAAWQRVERAGARLVLAADKDFPQLLREIPWQPHALYVRGEQIGGEAKLAIVGTRKATAAGMETAKRLAGELARAGLTIVSGLALGIDAAAHEGALAAGGKTIAVLACGADVVYPRQNERLARRILESKGTIVSEYPPGSAAYVGRFIERNRITSGLAAGSLVIEAPQRSGGLATARFAVEQNREVFVVPGMITNPNYVGSHELIRSGATLITDAAQITQQLGIAPDAGERIMAGPQFDKLEKKHKIILQALRASGMPQAVDQLSAATGLPVAEVSEALTLLAMDNYIEEENGTYFIQ